SSDHRRPSRGEDEYTYAEESEEEAPLEERHIEPEEPPKREVKQEERGHERTRYLPSGSAIVYKDPDAAADPQPQVAVLVKDTVPGCYFQAAWLSRHAVKAVEAGEEMCLQEEEGAHPGKGRGAHDPPEEAGRAEGVHRGGRASERLQKVWSDLKGVICARNGATQYRWGCRYPEGCCWGWNAWPASKLILTGSGGQPSDEGEAGSHRCGGGIEEKEGATRQISGGGFSSRCNFTERGCEGEQEEVTQVVGPLKESEEKEKEKAQLQRGFEEPVQWEQQLERRQPSSSAQAEVAEVAGSGAQDVGRTCLREAGTRCDSGGRPGREHELSGEGHGSCLVSLAPTQVARQQGELFLLARMGYGKVTEVLDEGDESSALPNVLLAAQQHSQLVEKGQFKSLVSGGLGTARRF
ncbi:unnamed protein product, partial [Cladocopium goreaui]